MKKVKITHYTATTVIKYQFKAKQTTTIEKTGGNVCCTSTTYLSKTLTVTCAPRYQELFIHISSCSLLKIFELMMTDRRTLSVSGNDVTERTLE